MRAIYDFWSSLKQDADESWNTNLAAGVLFFLFFVFAIIFSLTSPAPEHRLGDRLILDQTEILVRGGKVTQTVTPLTFTKLWLLSLPLRYLLGAAPSVQLFFLRIIGILIGSGILYALWSTGKNMVKHRLFGLLVLGSVALNPLFVTQMTTLADNKIVILLTAFLAFFLTEIVEKETKVTDVIGGLVVVYIIFRLMPPLGMAVALPSFIIALIVSAFKQYGGKLNSKLKEKPYSYAGLVAAGVAIALALTRLSGPELVTFPAQSLIRPLASISALKQIAFTQAQLASAIHGLPAGFIFVGKALEYVFLITGLISLIGLMVIASVGLATTRAADADSTALLSAAFLPVLALALFVFNLWGLWQPPYMPDSSLQALGMTILSIFFALGLFGVSVVRKAMIGDVAVAALATSGLATLMLISLFQ